jgi:hypothetical protein
LLGVVLLTASAQAEAPRVEAPRVEAPQGASRAVAAYSADGLYNLANSYQRVGKPGMAILNYERAGLLAPDDADIAANLGAVRVANGLPTEPATWFARTATRVSPLVAAWLAVLGLLLIGASAILGLGIPRLRWLRAAGVLMGMLLIGLTVANGVVLWPRLHRAIVLVAGTPIRATPAPLGEPLLTVPEGTAVKMLGAHQDFVFVEVKPTVRGWVSRASIAAVIP